MADSTVADTTLPRERVDVVVIGAGQAGLAVGHYLRDAGRSFRILEAGESVGAAWRKRWDSLALFTSRQFDALPGMAFPGDPDGYPTRDETVAYLESYAILGLPWQYSRGSALLGFVKDDARYIADRIEAARTTAAKEYGPPDIPTESTTGVS